MKIIKHISKAVFVGGLVLLSSLHAEAQLVVNGSLTGSPCSNSGVSSGAATGWTGCGYSPDLCCLALPSYVATSQVPAVLSPDGGTWLGIAALGECAQTTITGLVPGVTYTLYFCGACFGTGTTIFNSAPANPKISVGATSISPSIPMASSWTRYSMPFVANAATMTLLCQHLTGSNSYASLDGFSLLATSPCGTSPLPEEMTGFEADYNKENKGVDLSWTVALEKNVDHYEVERSMDAQQFQTIDQVSALVSGSDAEKIYISADKRPMPNAINYYRILTVDKDGQRELSAVREVMVSDAFADPVLSPNPAVKELDLALGADMQGIWTVQVMNVMGLIVDAKEIDASGSGHLQLDVSGYTAGLYFVNISNGQSVYKRKFIKQ